MGTEVAISFSTLRAQLESEKSSLFKIDENIKKIVQTSRRFSNDRFHASGDYGRGGARVGGRNSFPDVGSFGKDEVLGKRKQETKTVFSRLSARAGDSDGEEDIGFGGPKRARVVSAVTREMPTRASVVRAQSGDEAARTRNRRMFGSLLGTLQKFKQDEISLQTKEEKKAQVERKIEEQARLQKERELKERKSLFAERESRKATIKALEAKMHRVADFEKWEASQKSLTNFILTKAKPHLYWLPAKMSDKAQEKLNSSRRYHEKCMSTKRQELQDELQRIEQRILRKQGSQPNGQNLHNSTNDVNSSLSGTKDENGRKRDKFAVDDDHHEGDDSDNDGHTRNGKHDHTDKDSANKENKMSSKDAAHKFKPIADDDIEPPPPGTTDIDIPDLDTPIDTAYTTIDTADTTIDTADTTIDTADTTIDTADTTIDTADKPIDSADKPIDNTFSADDHQNVDEVEPMNETTERIEENNDKEESQ